MVYKAAAVVWRDEITTQREGEEHTTGVGFWTNATC